MQSKLNLPDSPYLSKYVSSRLFWRDKYPPVHEYLCVPEIWSLALMSLQS